MKKNICRKLKMLALYSFRGIILQIFFVNFLFAMTSTEAQRLEDIKININITNVSLQEAIHTIEQKTNLVFSYNSKEIPLDEEVSLNFNEASVSEVLTKLGQDLGLTFSQVDNIIIIKKTNANVHSSLQTGTIKGTVTDKNTKDVLYGANIIVHGTNLGAAADIDGNFIIYNVAAGNQVLDVSYLGYKTLTLNIYVSANKTSQIDIKLEPEALEANTVLITAQAKGQLQAINQQLTSNTITNVVSADRIRQLPDDNVAAALARLPGVSLMNGDQVVIRGMQAKMNSITINGIQLPSTDMNTRATDLGFLSSNMLSGIEVIKALTPDLDANAIGGVVNLKLIEAPKDLHFDVLTQGNYNAQDKTTDNYKFWLSVSDRFFDNKLGVFLQGNADHSDVGDQVASASYGIFQNLPYGQAPYEMNSFTFNSQINYSTNNGGSLILDYVLPHGKVVFQNTYAHNITDNASMLNVLDLNLTELTYSIFRDKYGKDLWMNSLQSEYYFGDIKAEFRLSHSSTNKYTLLRYGDPGYNFGFINVKQQHPFGVDAQGKTISYSGLRQYLTPQDVYNIQIDPTDPLGAEIQGWIMTRNEAFFQHNYNASLDFTAPLSFSEDVSSIIKFGGKFLRVSRQNDIIWTYKGYQDPDFYGATATFFPGKVESPTNPLVFSDLWDRSYKRGQNLLNGAYDFKYAFDRGLMDKYMLLSRTGWIAALDMPDSKANDFNGAEIFSAAYLMGTFNFGPQLTLIGGLRFEHYNMDYNANFTFGATLFRYAILLDTLNTIDRSDDNIFPNAQLRYKFNDWSDIRLAFTKGISRPDYTAIMPKTFYEPNAIAEAGNTKLKPAISTNLDVEYSLHNNEIGLFTISGFFKKIDNVFYPASVYYKNIALFNISFPDSAVFNRFNIPAPGASQQINTFLNNPHPAYVRGIELDWQTNFWYLPKPLNALVLNVNYTKAWSDMDYQQVRNIDSTYQVGRFTYHNYITIDTIRNARLLYQGDDVLNIALGVDYTGFSGRISFNLSGNVITSVGSRPETDQYTGNIYRWDFTVKQELPLDGLSIAFNGVNIFHNPIYTYQDFRRYVGGPVLQNLESTDYSPTIFEVNLRYSF
jgi:TonB-dependent receptor